MQSISRFAKIFPAIFLRFAGNYPREPRADPLPETATAFSSFLKLRGAPTIAASLRIIAKTSFTKTLFGTINFVNISKQSLDNVNSFACSLATRAKPVAATLQRKRSGGIFITKIVTKENVPRNYFVIISVRMVNRSFPEVKNRREPEG